MSVNLVFETNSQNYFRIFNFCNYSVKFKKVELVSSLEIRNNFANFAHYFSKFFPKLASEILSKAELFPYELCQIIKN